MNSFPKVWSTILQQSSYSDSRTLIREITRLLYTGNIWPLGSNHCNFLLTCLTFVLNTPLQVLQEPWSLAPRWKVVLLLWSVKAASFPAHFFYYLKLSPWEYAQLFRSDPKESMTPGGKFFAGFKVHCDIIFNLFKSITCNICKGSIYRNNFIIFICYYDSFSGIFKYNIR